MTRALCASAGETKKPSLRGKTCLFHRKKFIKHPIGLAVWLAMLLLTISIGSPMILDTVYAQEDTKAIGAVQLESNQPGLLEVS